VATQFLTRLPVPALTGFEPSWLTKSVRFFPLVGALVGALGVGVWWLASRCFPPAVAVGLMMAASLLVTGALHEDGFADTCDGFGGGPTRERVLEIMKDSRLGAYGVVGITMMLGLKWVTLAALPSALFPLLVVAAHMMSRWCANGLIWGLPYVRAEGESKSKPRADSLSGVDWVLSGLLGAVAVAALMVRGPRNLPPLERAAFGAAVLAAAVCAATAAAYFKRRIGGYTGDCLGAVQQLSELAFLLTALGVLSKPRGAP